MIKRRFLASITAGLLAASLIPFSGAAADTAYINNADLMPKYVPDSQVTLDAQGTPEWVSGLILTAVRIQTATPEGTLASAVKVLDHYQEMGVNGLWILPVYDPGAAGNGYSNLGPHSIDPRITGKEGKNDKTTIADYEEGWQEFKKFVDEAHKRNIRIILDTLSWGVAKDSKLPEKYPSYFSSTKENVDGFNYEWKDPNTEEMNQPFIDWYIKQHVEIAQKTGLDGWRFDSEPRHAGYAVHDQLRQALYKSGRKMMLMSEHSNDRGQIYDLEQQGVEDSWNNRLSNSPKFTFLDKYNLVDSIKNGKNIGSSASQALMNGGTYRFYTHGLTNHDHLKSTVQGNRLAIGYQAIYAPFIPMWYMGEEWIETYQQKPDIEAEKNEKVLYAFKLDWSNLDKAENRKFYEDVKAMIRVRRQYPEIFSYFPEEHRNTNICKVDVTGCEGDLAYARYSGDTAIVVVPNYNVHDKSGKMTVYLPFEDMGLDHYSRYTVTDAITGKSILSGNAKQVAEFAVTVPANDMRVIKVQASGKYEVKDNPGTDPGGNTSSNPAGQPDSSQAGEPDASSDYNPAEDPASEPDDNPTSEPEDNPGSDPGSSPNSSAGTQSPAPVIKPEDPKSGGPTLWIILGVVGGVLVLGGAGAVIYAVRKRSVK